MSSNYNKLIKISVKISLVLLVILWYFKSPMGKIDYIEIVGTAAGFAVIPTLIYEKWMWKLNPFDDTPKLKSLYNGCIKFYRDNEWHEKEIRVKIDQTFTNVIVKVRTNEIFSKSLISDIIFENGGYVLYYTYITNPKSEYGKDNPIQIGSAKILIEENEKMYGVYWTNRKTIGDIYFKEENKEMCKKI